MRFLERTLLPVYLARALPAEDGLGGVSRRFAAARQAVRGSILPVEGDWASGEGGVIDGRRLRVLLPLDARIEPGDGMALKPFGAVKWVCRDVRRWSAHLAADFERVAGA